MAARFWPAVVVAIVTLRAALARAPGWNPPSLWSDDLVWAAIANAREFPMAIGVPAHAGPGFFAVLWGLRAAFGDPEWSLQVLPFVCGVTAIPLMAVVAWKLTNDRGLALLAASLTALNPLLTHYTVYVKQYSLDFFVTALVLLFAVWTLRSPIVQSRRFVQYAIGAGIAPLFSVTSVFASFAVINLAAFRSWLQRRPIMPIVGAALVYDLLILACFMLLRSRANPLVTEAFGSGFMPTDSWGSASAFLLTEGRRLVETGLPTWRATDIWSPETVSWTLPIVACGLVWLVARPSTRYLGLAVLGFVGSVLTASALGMYPVGFDRTDIFAFPVVIVLFVMGVHALTAWLAKPALPRLAVGLLIALFAAYAPIRAEYWAVNDSLLVRQLETAITPADGLVLSPSGTFLVANYGNWPVVVSGTSLRTNGTRAEIDRPLTAHLPPRLTPGVPIDALVFEFRPRRLWFVAFRYDREWEVLAKIRERGYEPRVVAETTRGRLYVAEDIGE